MISWPHAARFALNPCDRFQPRATPMPKGPCCGKRPVHGPKRASWIAPWPGWNRALSLFQRFDLTREVAITRGEMADILQARAELDAALKIRTEEELPVYERLGDRRELLVGRAPCIHGHLGRLATDPGEKCGL